MDICIAVAPTRGEDDVWNALFFEDGRTSGFFATNELLCGATNAFAEEASVSATRAMMLVADTFMMVRC